MKLFDAVRRHVRWRPHASFFDLAARVGAAHSLKDLNRPTGFGEPELRRARKRLHEEGEGRYCGGGINNASISRDGQACRHAAVRPSGGKTEHDGTTTAPARKPPSHRRRTHPPAPRPIDSVERSNKSAMKYKS